MLPSLCKEIIKSYLTNMRQRKGRLTNIQSEIGPVKVYHQATTIEKKTFCGFSMGRNQYWAGRVYDLCVYYMTGTPEGSTESGFMEKPLNGTVRFTSS